MVKKENIKAAGQAAVELAVFGAILIFLLGSIVRTAAGNSFTQNQNFKAMRMAMLASWRGSEAGNTARNNASVLVLEDRLSPDVNKYGDVDRTPYLADGAGTFSYQMIYPVDVNEVGNNLPVEDIYINGQHFPLTTAAFVQYRTLAPNMPCPMGNTVPPQSPALTQSNCLNNATTPAAQQACLLQAQEQCLQNQCLRNNREWTGGIVNQSDFNNVIPVTVTGQSASQVDAAMAVNAQAIYNELISLGLIGSVTTGGGTLSACGSSTSTIVASGLTSGQTSSAWASFAAWFNQTYPSQAATTQINNVQAIVTRDSYGYKLFYSQVPNGTAQFSVTAPVCTSHPCKDQELSSDVLLKNGTGCPMTGSNGQLLTNSGADMEYDLMRNADYNTPGDPEAVESSTQMGAPETACINNSQKMRCNIAWQWSATGATSAALIGLDAGGQQYPIYDIDGRLKEQTIYYINQNTGATPSVTVSYEDSQGGDIDPTWDSNSCTSKPGLQPDSQIYTFTKQGTYLLIKEGKAYNPETGQFVRSVNQRDTIDLIQRTLQLSNDTGRFCNESNPVAPVPQTCMARCLISTNLCSGASPNGSLNSVISTIVSAGSSCCTPSAANNNCNCTPATIANSGSITTPGFGSNSCSPDTVATPTSVAESANFVPDQNPVEACVNGSGCPSGPYCSCFSTQNNIKSTCFDIRTNTLYIRSRVEDRRGHWWMTNANGQAGVH